jgi:MFS transporter, DHA1 family, inner membrane transport protein
MRSADIAVHAAVSRRDPLTAVVAVGLCTFLGILPSNIIPFQIGVLIDSCGLSELQASFIGTSEIAAVAVTAISVSPFVHRVSHSKCAIAGICLAAAAQVISMLVSTFTLLLICRLLAGVGLGFVYAAATSAGAAAINPDRVYGVAQGMALALAAPLYALMGIVGAHGDQFAYFLVCAIMILAVLPACQWLDSDAARADALSGAQGYPLRSGMVLGLITVLFNLGLSPIWAFVERVGVNLHLSKDRVGLLLSVAGVAGVAGSLTASWVGSRVARKPVLILAFILAAASGASTMSGLSIPLWGIGAFVYVYTFSFIYPYLLAVGADLDSSGRLNTALVGMGMIANSFGPLIGGVLATERSYARVGVFCVALCVAVLVLLLFSGHMLRPRARSDEGEITRVSA